jgi:hypothetical protein
MTGDSADGLPPIIGFSENLDRMELSNACEGDDNTTTIFQCLSPEQAASEVSILIPAIITASDPTKLCDAPHCGRVPTTGHEFSLLVVIVDGGLPEIHRVCRQW